MKTSGHTILITGGATGIGLALARQFHAQGNQLVLTGRDAAKLTAAAASMPGTATFPCNLSDPASLDALCDYMTTNHTGLSVLINNAGIQLSYNFKDEPDSLQHILTETSVNFTAPLTLTNRLMPLLSGQPEAAVVFVSSALYIAPKRSAPVYCATKSAVHTFAKALRYQLEGSGIRVFDIIPPLVDTAMTAERSSGKISPEQLAVTFIKGFGDNRYEQHIGKSRLLKILSRIMPALTDRMMKNG